MLSKIKLGPKFIGGFVIISLITLIVGIIGLLRIKDIGQVHLPSIVRLQQFQRNMDNIRAAERTLLIQGITDKTREFQLSRMEDSWNKANEERSAYESIPKSKEESILWNQFGSLFNDWKKLDDEKMDLIKNGKNSEALLLSTGDWSDAWVEWEKVIDQLIADTRKHSDETVKSSTTLMISLSIAGFIIALTLGIWLTISITKPISQMVEVANKLSEGDVEQEIKYNSGDEIGILANAFRQMITYIKGLASASVSLGKGELSIDLKPKSEKDILSKSFNSVINTMKEFINEANTIAKAVVEGKLELRGNKAKFSGDYGKLMEGINNIIDTLVSHLDSVTTPIMIIDKEFNIMYMNKAGADVLGQTQSQLIGQKCYNNFKTSDCNTANCACARAMQIGQMASSNTDAHPAGKNLTISYNGVPLKDETGKVIGALEVVQDTTAITNMMSSIEEVNKYQAKEVDRLSDNLDKLAVGDVNFDLKVDDGNENTKAVRENFLKIAGSMTKVKDTIDSLIADSDMLTRSALEGKLDTRADVTKHQGDFRRLITGINDTLDAIIKPINESGEVLREAAEGNLTKRIVGDYKGQLAEMKNNINAMLDSLDNALSQVNVSVNQISSASGQIASGSQSLAEAASEQASSLEEISSSLEELSSMAKQNADNANQAKNLSQQASDSAKIGNQSMEQMSEAINKIKTSSDETAKIIKTIDEIAFQTNLLALNAAVEAARAGEAGKGFAVVAEEVRNLAQRSAKAAKDTADLIQESTQNADGGVKIAEEVARAFGEINQNIGKVNDLIAEISAASTEQSQGIGQINTAVADMDKITQSNAANSEESASAAQELSAQVADLRNMISRFKLSDSSSSQILRNEASNVVTVPKAQPRKEKKARANSESLSKLAKQIPLDDSELAEF